MAERDRLWLMRTYSGHSSAKASNELYRTNLAKGQTGLSVALTRSPVPRCASKSGSMTVIWRPTLRPIVIA